MLCLRIFMLAAVVAFVGSAPLAAKDKKSTPLNIYFNPGANQNGWFTTNNISITFDPPISPTDIQGYSMLLSQSPFYEADLVPDTNQPHWQFTDIPEGSAYLSIHVQKKDGRWIKGSVVRIKVDTIAPPAPSLIQCFDSLFEKHQLAADSSQALTNRPFFKWTQKPTSDTESPVRRFKIRWQTADGKTIEELDSLSASFFPTQPVQYGDYRLLVTSIDEAGWESANAATFGFIYSAK